MKASAFRAGTGPVAVRNPPPWLGAEGVVLAHPEIVVVDEGSGERLRIAADGFVEPVLPGGHPRPGAAHATARAEATATAGVTR